MNPIQKFEDCVRTISESDLEASQKAERLWKLQGAINQYLARVEALGKAPSASPDLPRAVQYLKDLKRRVREMAEAHTLSERKAAA